MVIGLDVTHPSPGSSDTAPSVAALVSSVDKYMAQFPAQIRVQAARQERIDSLGILLKSALDRWKLHNKQYPENILVCRDGVSEGQYAMVRDNELKDLRDMARTVYSPEQTKQGLPRFTVVVVGKRHNTRFYPATADGQDKRGNPAPGTVVDRGVTELLCWDFFLQSHQAIQGTARPAHYYVLYDDIFRRRGVPASQNAKQFSHAADAFESLMHSMCYMYGRATRAVSICPPAYYADIACERARCYLSGLFDPTEAESVLSGDSGSSARIRDELTAKTSVHKNLANTMFYI
jgi:eukaryotic translation initiation factor 2C